MTRSTFAVQQAYALALQHHQAGRLAEAEALYQQILAVQPNHAEALHHLGIVAHQTSRHELAADLIRQAIKLAPNNFAALSNLGEVLRALGRQDEAIAHFRHALQLNPNSPQAHYNLGFALKDRGALDEVIAAYRHAVALKPDYPEALNNLGAALAEQGRCEEAMAAYQQALAISPDFASAHYNLGNAFKGLGHIDRAIEAYRRALQFQPTFAEAHYNFGRALHDLDRRDEAMAEYRLALQFKPDYAPASYNLGHALHEQCRLEEALANYRQALEIKPDYIEAINNLANTLKALGRLDEAIDAYRQALQFKPDASEIHNNLGNALRERGQADEALATLRQALRINPNNAWLHSNLIYALHLRPRQDTVAIAAEYHCWNRRFGDPLKATIVPHVNDRNPTRRLRLGYVSPDFREHPVSFFFAPLLEAHDHGRFEIYCYASVSKRDDVTKRLRKGADCWKDVGQLSDEQLARCIRNDGVDILVDLAMHTAGNRLLTFAHQPSPVQVAWLAYPASVGVDAIRFELTDGYINPPEPADTEAGTQLVRLPGTWCCYAPIAEFPPVGPPPVMRRGTITFGSLNQFAKINEALLRCWARLLGKLPEARLIIVCPAGQASEQTLRLFESQGVARDRVELVRFGPWESFIRLLERIDVALDSFPCNGMTTTCHTLWMGVPVVSLAGQTSVSRAGLSQLTNLGLPELVAFTEDQYVDIADRLAKDLPRLSKLRATLRQRMENSVLMDAPRFARQIEDAYRAMWRQWCASETS